MFSLIFTNDSPSGKQLTVASPSGTPMLWQISSARARFEEPEKILSFVSLMSRFGTGERYQREGQSSRERGAQGAESENSRNPVSGFALRSLHLAPRLDRIH